MMNENPNKEPPSLGEMFERTRKRTEGKSYVDSYEDLSKKIEEIQKFTPSEDGKGQTDAFLAIMGKEHNGHRRLYGRGVTNKKLRKASNSDSSYVVPGELMQSIKAGVVEDIQKDMESEVMKLQDMRKEIEADYAKKKSELEQMQTQVENQRGDMFETIMANIISKLPTDIARKYLS